MTGEESSLQFESGKLRHLLTLAEFPPETARRIFGLADDFRGGKLEGWRPLEGRLFVNVFFELSTRTRAALEAAGKQLGADVVNLDQTTMSGEAKGESVADTILTLSAMGARGAAVRHGREGAAAEAARAAPNGMAIVNGGDGCNAHPTQGLADAYTLREEFGGDFSGLTAAIVGDCLHSRVARTDAHILRALGAREVRFVGPAELCPRELEGFGGGGEGGGGGGEGTGGSGGRGGRGVRVFHDLEEGLEGADAVILLRVQRERMRDSERPDAESYFRDYGMTAARAEGLKRGAVVMHPGPINRGVEIDSAVADGPRSRILRQVQNGMAVRKAALSLLCGGLE